MMATAKQIRAWAKADGRWPELGTNGRVPDDARAAYEAAHATNGHGAAAPDYPPGMDETQFETADADEPEYPEPGTSRETPPRRPKSPRSAEERYWIFRRRASSAQSAAKKRAARSQPRVSAAELIGSGWRIAAKLARPVPPLYRTLRLQSVIAGPLLDDAAKDTVVDTFLQPLARLTAMGETASALILPPAGIGAMAVHVGQATRQGIEPNPVVMQACAEVTRHGFLAMMRVGGERFAEQLARERDDEERYGPSVDAIMAWVMAPPADPAEEDATLRRMTATLSGQPETMPA